MGWGEAEIRAGPLPRGCFSRSSSHRACKTTPAQPLLPPLPTAAQLGHLGSLCTRGVQAGKRRAWNRAQGPQAQPGSAQDTEPQGMLAPVANPSRSQEHLPALGCAGTAPALPSCCAETTRAPKPNLTPALRGPKVLLQPKPLNDLPELC